MRLIFLFILWSSSQGGKDPTVAYDNWHHHHHRCRHHHHHHYLHHHHHYHLVIIIIFIFTIISIIIIFTIMISGRERSCCGLWQLAGDEDCGGTWKNKVSLNFVKTVKKKKVSNTNLTGKIQMLFTWRVSQSGDKSTNILTTFLQTGENFMTFMNQILISWCSGSRF